MVIKVVVVMLVVLPFFRIPILKRLIGTKLFYPCYTIRHTLTDEYHELRRFVFSIGKFSIFHYIPKEGE